MKKLTLILIAMVFMVAGCVRAEYGKELYTQIGGKNFLVSKEYVKYHSNDEKITSKGMSAELSNGTKFGTKERKLEGDPNLIKAYGEAVSNGIGAFNGTNAIESIGK